MSVNKKYLELADKALEILAGRPGYFTRFPNAFFILLKADEGKRAENGGKYKAAPPSFWKFLFVMWHELMWPRDSKKELSASLSLRQFGIRPKDACLWATAIVASGLFSISSKGDFSNRKATTYVYHAAGSIAWQGFYRGLMMAYGEWRASRDAVRQMGFGESMKAWAQMVKIAVQRETEALR